MTHVVLDSMYFRDVKESELVALKRRGLRIALACFTIDEVWASSTRADKPGLILRRMRVLAPHLDPEHPVLPAGSHLKKQLNASPVHRKDLRSGFPERFKVFLRTMAESETFPADQWRSTGAEANAWIDELSVSHVDTLSETRRKEYPGIETFSPEEAISAIKRDFARVSGIGQHLARLDAFFAVMALDTFHAARKTPNRPTPKENDAEDNQLLQSLAFPAIVATEDKRLIARVDESRTYQAPWVRTLGDLLEDELPEGLPWGPSAKRQAARFVRRRASSRAKHEVAALARVQGESCPEEGDQ